MGNVVTINITNNCCCGGGGTDGTSPGNGDYPPPSDGTIVPPGYDESTLEDRPCKVAIWLYDWVDSWLQVVVDHTFEFNLMLQLANATGSRALTSAITALLAFVVSLLATPGLTPDDAAWTAIGAAIGYGLASLGAELINKVTEETIPTTSTKFTGLRDQFICKLSQGGTPAEVATKLNQFFQDNFELPERVLLKMFIPDTFLNLFHYSAEWWPSFDTDYLATITETCCGTFENGGELSPGSTEGCQTANWIVDNLITTFNGIQKYYNAYFWPTGDGLDVVVPFGVVEQFKTATKTELPKYIPAKVIRRSNNPKLLYDSVGVYIYQQVYHYADLFQAMDDYNWENMADELLRIKPDVLADLREALDSGEAFMAIYEPLNTWITANVESDLAVYMRGAITAIAQPGGQFGLASLMFYQDADLAFYAQAACAGEAVPDESFTPNPDGWTYVTGQCSAGVPVGNEAEGDGNTDGVMAGKYSNTWHAVEFTPKTIGANACFSVYWKYSYGTYMGLGMDACIDGVWTQLRWSGYQSTSGRWEQQANFLAGHVGKQLTGFRFRGQGGFWVDGYRCKNITEPA